MAGFCRISPIACLPLLFCFGLAGGLWTIYYMALIRGVVSPLTIMRPLSLDHNYNVHHSTICPPDSPRLTMFTVTRCFNGTPYPPFISIAGAFQPMSSHFSQLMNLAAFLGLAIGILRFLQLKRRLPDSRLNSFSTLTYAVAMLGMSMLGSYQVFSHTEPHILGTVLTFVLGTGYCWSQAFLTARARLRCGGWLMVTIRFLLSTGITGSFVMLYALIFYSLVFSARCEWLLVAGFIVYIGTFAAEFSHLHVGTATFDRRLRNQTEKRVATV